MRSALLLGREHGEIGSVGEEAAGAIAVALSRGGAAKQYAHTDPNEDAALAAQGSHGLLVAVADGHWGHRAAEVALCRLRNAHAEAWIDGKERSAEAWYQDLLHALVEINDAILDAHSPDQRSRTTLALALARPTEGLLVAASVGDSHLFLAGDEVTELLPRPRHLTFLGHERLAASQLAREARIEVQPLDEAWALAAVTDGLSEEGIGVDQPREAVRLAVCAAREAEPPRRAATAARTLLDAALAAHVAHQAGDNVAAALAWIAR